MSFSFQDRYQYIQDSQREEYDIVIIGGGITGAGVARDAALRGLKVFLLDAQDYASGTSSRSSKLVHGGIRYLENLEFHLVFEALSERANLLKMAPHLVHPLRFMIPLYRGGRVGYFKMGLGMWLYDALALFRSPKLHESLSSKNTLKRQPVIQSEGLLGSYVYSDAYMDDDRLVYETLRSAVVAGAKAVNYVKAVGVDWDQQGQKISAVKVQDKVTGKSWSVSCKHVVSAVGPWTDQLGESIFKDWQKCLRPTKGVHLTFEKSRLPLNSAIVMAAEERIVFAIPRHEMVIIGTTDTDFSGDPGQVSTTPDDVNYLLGVAAKYFPEANLQKEDIVASYAGVRPLVKDNSATVTKTSREHTIFSDQRGITYVAGGKYTTYRLMAEQIVDESLNYLESKTNRVIQDCSTNTALNPKVTLESKQQWDALKIFLKHHTRLSEQECQWLVERHGHEAVDIVEYGAQYSYLQLEAIHAIRHTMCLGLVDFYCRRVPLFLANRDHGWQAVDQIIEVFKQELGWNATIANDQKIQLERFIHDELRWKSKTN